MVDYQTISIVLTGAGMIIALTYYSMQVRNQNRTRQIQLIMQLANQRNEEASKRNLELLSMEWNDYDEFESKYGSDNNPENFGKRVASWHENNTLGLLLKKGLVDADTLFSFMHGNSVMYHWAKFESVIKEIRRRYKMPLMGAGFEYLADENRKYLERRGFKVEVPETFYQYIPEN